MVVAGLVVTAAVAGATVMHEPIAYAAEKYVIVKNTAEEPVPVATSEKTELVTKAIVSASQPVTVDVSRYRALRFATQSQGCNINQDSFFYVDAVEDGGFFLVKKIQLCQSDSGFVPAFAEELAASTLEVPGRTIRIRVTGGGGSAELVVFGRTN